MMARVDDVGYESLKEHLDYLVEHGALVARLASVSDRLALWRDGDEDAGSIAADALDQLDGLLAEMKQVVEALEREVPQALKELPSFPE